VALTVAGMDGMLLSWVLVKALSEEAARTSPMQGCV